jgi:hypothetical protein
MAKEKVDIEKLKSDVGLLLDGIKESDPKRYATLISGEEELKKLFTGEREVKVKRNPLWIGKTLAEMRTAFYGHDRRVNPNTPEGKKWGEYVKVRMNPDDTGVSRASTFRYAAAWRNAVLLLTEPVVTLMARDKRMIDVKVSEENPLGRFTELAKKFKSKIDPKKPETVKAFVDTVLESSKATSSGHVSSAANLAALHSTILRTIRLRMKKDKTEVTDPHAAQEVVLGVIRDLVRAFAFEGTVSIEPPTQFSTKDDQYVTWEMYTREDRKKKKKASKKAKEAPAVTKPNQQAQGASAGA